MRKKEVSGGKEKKRRYVTARVRGEKCERSVEQGKK